MTHGTCFIVVGGLMLGLAGSMHQVELTQAAVMAQGPRGAVLRGDSIENPYVGSEACQSCHASVRHMVPLASRADDAPN